MLNHVFADIGNAALWGGALALLFLCAQYAALARWGRRGSDGRRIRPTLEGVSITGLALGIVIIYAPSILALIGGPRNFAATDWYFWLAVATVIWVLIFACILVWCWERVRRHRRRAAGN